MAKLCSQMDRFIMLKCEWTRCRFVNEHLHASGFVLGGQHLHHTRIFSWSAQMEHVESLLIKLSAFGQRVLKTACFFRSLVVR